jgi:integrase
MREARRERAASPFKAAVKAQVAVAIAMLSFAPVRIGNLARTRLDENLVRSRGPNSPYWLVYPGYDVKNRVDLQFPFDDELTRLISEYIAVHRPILLRGCNERWLFAGEDGCHKRPTFLSAQLGRLIYKRVGLSITAHQFRHVAGAILLKRFHGNYELVRRVLGHRSIETTRRAYVGLETLEANELFGELVRENLRFEARQ